MRVWPIYNTHTIPNCQENSQKSKKEERSCLPLYTGLGIFGSAKENSTIIIMYDYIDASIICNIYDLPTYY